MPAVAYSAFVSTGGPTMKARSTRQWLTGAALTLAAALSLPPPSGAQQSGERLGQIKAQLYYEGTGRLSPDILTAKDFALWNTIIGEGSAEEIANDLFVSVELASNGQRNLATPLRITVRGRGRVLAERTFTGILTSKGGRISKGLYLRDAGCAGPVTIEARFGDQRRTASLDLACGE